ncbi:hypothetical protein ACFQY0_13280 [Haloferula chungangensis]|uniref:Cox cluster protein n=1 Tax=Haloferula chungangensis TaxID=1048331 RepID=A0ABW2LAI3_9BACT
MNQPPPDQAPPDMPVAPPKMNLRRLWLTLLLPMGLTSVFMVLIVTASSGRMEEHFLNAGMLVVGLASLICWVAFSKCIAERFAGPSLILLILAYPILQAVLVFCAFFVGCLVMIQAKGFH